MSTLIARTARRARPPSSCQTGTSKCLPFRSHSAWSTALMAPVTAMPRKLRARYSVSQ